MNDNVSRIEDVEKENRPKTDAPEGLGVMQLPGRSRKDLSTRLRSTVHVTKQMQC